MAGTRKTILSEQKSRPSRSLYVNLDEAHKKIPILSQISMYQPAINKQHQKRFFQAVVDDDIENIKNFLDEYPILLLDKPRTECVIESKYTWRKFNVRNENALTIAAKLSKDHEVLTTLLFYLNKIKNHKIVKEAKAEFLSNWALCGHKEEKARFDIPDEYTTILQKMIDVFKEETFPNGVKAGSAFSYQTEVALHQFREKLLPENPITLDKSIKIELFLYAAHKVFDDNFNSFDNCAALRTRGEKGVFRARTAYCIYVIGFIQSLLTPQLGRELCEGLLAIVKQKGEISPQAHSLKLMQGESFYRSSPSSLEGLGGKYHCSLVGHAEDSWSLGWLEILEKRYLTKTVTMRKILTAPTAKLSLENGLNMLRNLFKK
ncbi:MAG: hypothetical protein JO131_05290 [Gammaproteobacteria bacterium]|nr:hypothetical protein [Gammaproteobacteria bacterium]